MYLRKYTRKILFGYTYHKKANSSKISAKHAININCSNIGRQLETNNKDLNDNYMFGTYFGTVSFFMISMPEKNLSGVFSEPHLDFCDKCDHILHSFQYLTSAKEYKGTYSGLQIWSCLTCDRRKFDDNGS